MQRLLWVSRARPDPELPTQSGLRDGVSASAYLASNSTVQNSDPAGVAQLRSLTLSRSSSSEATGGVVGWGDEAASASRGTPLAIITVKARQPNTATTLYSPDNTPRVFQCMIPKRHYRQCREQGCG